MKKTQKLLCIILLFCLLGGFLPTGAEAATVPYHITICKFNQKTWVTAKGVQDRTGYDSDYYIYKMNVPAGGYVRVYINTSNSKLRMRPFIFKTLPKDSFVLNADRLLEFINPTTYVSLEKGTYYLYANAGTKIKWDFQKKSHPGNYCMAKASTLAAGKNTVLYFDYGYEHAQWFKVTLSKKQRILAFVRNMDAAYTPDVLILNQKGRLINSSFSSEYTRRTAALPKGTYYIRISRSADYLEDQSDNLDDGRIYSFTWKKQ